MIHFFTRPKIHIDCFTSRMDVIDKAPIVNAIEVIPNWWKKLPKEGYINNSFYPVPTMKTCVGMYDYYAKSLALPLWSDVCIKVSNGGYEWQFSDKTSIADIHNDYQYTGFVGKDYGQLKLISPWFFKTKSNIDWLVSAPIYNVHSFRDYVLAQGLLNFSEQYATHLQLLVDLAIDKVFIIPFGTPTLLTPLTDKKIVIHRHLISDLEQQTFSQSSLNSTFVNKHKKPRLKNCPYRSFIK